MNNMHIKSCLQLLCIYRSRHHKLSLQLGLPDRPSSDNLSKRWVSGDKVLDGGASLHHEMELDDDDRMLKGVDIDHVAS